MVTPAVVQVGCVVTAEVYECVCVVVELLLLLEELLDELLEELLLSFEIVFVSVCPHLEQVLVCTPSAVVVGSVVTVHEPHLWS